MNVAVRALLRYVLPLAMIAVLSIYLVARRDDQLHYELPDLPSMAAASVDRIEVERGATRVVLSRIDDGWLIDGPGYPAEARIIDEMVRTAATITLTDLIASKPTYSRYGLGEEAITVTFLKGSHRLRVLSIGKRSPTYGHTYVLIDGDPRVYQATGDLTRSFSNQMQVLRSRSILSFEKNDITAISVRTSDGTSEFFRSVLLTPKTSPNWSIANGGDLDSKKIRQALDLLAEMKANRFIEAVPDSEPLVELEFHGQNLPHRLTIYRKANSAHVATSSDVTGPFVLFPVLLASVFEAFKVESK